MFYLQVLSLNAHLWVAINAEALFYWLINERSENIFIKAGAHHRRKMASFNFHIVDVKNLDSFYQIYGIAGFFPATGSDCSPMLSLSYLLTPANISLPVTSKSY